MKIAIDISQIIHEGSGVSRYSKNLVSTLLEVDNHNEYILFGYSLRKIQVLKEFYLKLKNKHSRVSAKLFHFPQIVMGKLWNGIHTFPLDLLIGKVDVFHSSDWIQPPTSAKKVTTVHDMTPFLYPQYSHPTIIAVQKRRMEWVKKECDAVITDSYATKNDFMTLTNMSEKRIHVVYPGVEDKFRKIPTKNILHIKRTYNIKGKYYLTVGTLEPRKNAQTAIEAYETVRKKIGEETPSLVVAGKEGWGNHISTSKGVKLLGYVPDLDLPALYSGAQAFIYPSFYEGFGLPVLEAMACECPVIASDRGSLSELVKGCALIINPENSDTIAQALLTIRQNNSERKRLIKNGIKNAQKFRWENTARQVLKVYEKL